MDLTSLLLAPVRVPLRAGQALDDLATLAERARRDPDPVEEARDRLDALLLELAAATVSIRELIDGGAELTGETKRTHATMRELLVVARGLLPAAVALRATGEKLHDGGEDLKVVAQALEVDTRELIDGGSRLTAVSELLEADMRVFRAALPRLLESLDTVEELEEAVETVAETIEPLQGAAAGVGRVTQRFSRSGG